MNEYKIWQVPKKHIVKYGFRALRPLQAELGKAELPRDKWELVGTYRTEKEPSLDWLFALFNDALDGIDRPGDYEGRSMSVGDIVETPDGRLWYCDSFGWKRVEWEAEG